MKLTKKKLTQAKQKEILDWFREEYSERYFKKHPDYKPKIFLTKDYKNVFIGVVNKNGKKVICDFDRHISNDDGDIYTNFKKMFFEKKK